MPLNLEDHTPMLPPLRVIIDEIPTLKMLSDEIDHLPSGKATENDNIPAEILQNCKGSLLPRLYQLLLQCLLEGEIPHVKRDAKIMTFDKDKGDKEDLFEYTRYLRITHCALRITYTWKRSFKGVPILCRSGCCSWTCLAENLFVPLLCSLHKFLPSSILFEQFGLI